MIIRGIRGAKIKEDIFNIKGFQILDADKIATKKHILHAINQAKTKKMITKDFWMEILVRASGQRQISEAIKIMGAKDGNVCLVCEDEEIFNKIYNIIGGEIDDSVLDLNEKKEKIIRNIFKIRGFGNLVERVLEKIALIELKGSK
ncbi:KEOPS complex Cgi121-like protein [Methanocaldococcus villosus KIN24-T80]|uniref:KEOPS complex Cgi121-like protein n=1 Tax=Methanocaldococcus villosus KIN24-T80 TaxID=1069083 RepID=N6VP97_9EURY|nr:KEOPS complex subunit Cgi121 [Methanocaldococcus villosus]ENN95695.1 KEOPS complex Cgi121-like protein [Methanocaldococcus villosus KIN24-T80]